MTGRAGQRRGTARRALVLGVGTAVAAGLAYVPFYFTPFRVFQLSLLLAWACALLGLNLLTGYSGQISLGHGAFFALGGYVAAILMTAWDGAAAALLALPLAAVVTFVVGFAFGIPALRLRGLYLALGTLALSVATPPLLRRFEGVTGGSAGLSAGNPPVPEAVPLAPDQWVYFLVLAVTVLLTVWARNLSAGRVGRALVALRDNETAAQTMGVQLSRYKTTVFAIASMYAGVAGCLYTWIIGFVSPESFGLLLSINLLAALVVGGLATIAGPFLGAAYILFVPALTERINGAIPGLVSGALLIGIVLLAPHGLAGLLRRAAGAVPRGVVRLRAASVHDQMTAGPAARSDTVPTSETEASAP